MTREEALGHEGDLVMECEDTPGINGLINVIYDSFEQRTCTNCKHDTTTTLCDKLIGRPPNVLTCNFGCNQFEPKVNH